MQSDDDEVRRRQQADATELMRICVDHLEAGTVRLVLVGGSPGTGKTTIATELGRRGGWTVLHSDVVRKQLSGHDADEPLAAAYRRGIYTPEMTEATYDALLERAGERLELGLSVVLDASFVAADDRACARRLAQQKEAEVVELRCTVDAATAARRIAARQMAGGDASDADPVIASQLAAEEDPWPESIEIDNTRSIRRSVTQGTTAIARVTRARVRCVPSDPPALRTDAAISTSANAVPEAAPSGLVDRAWATTTSRAW